MVESSKKLSTVLKKAKQKVEQEQKMTCPLSLRSLGFGR